MQSREFFFCFSLDTFNERKRPLAVTPNCFCSCVFPQQNIRSCRSFTGFEDSCQSLFTDKKDKERITSLLRHQKSDICWVFWHGVFAYFCTQAHFIPRALGFAPLGQKMSQVGQFCVCTVPFLTG